VTFEEAHAIRKTKYSFAGQILLYRFGLAARIREFRHYFTGTPIHFHGNGERVVLYELVRGMLDYFD
jgi:hypothetical protein